MKHLTSFLFIILTFLSCSKSVTITSEDAINLLNNKEYYFLDVRSLKEHKTRSIPNTDCIPLQDLENRINELNKYKNKNIIVYCRSGNRSGVASKILNDNGFNALNMIGGMNDWNGEVDKD